LIHCPVISIHGGRRIEILDDILEVVPSGKRIVVSLVSDRDRPRPVDVEAILEEDAPDEN
jgi:hypothetical protein